MARKKKPEEHENHERWLVSYADFITLLFAFFVVMYSVSSVNEGKYRVLSDSLMAAFRSSTKTLLPVQVGSAAKAPKAHSLDSRQAPVVVRAKNIPIPDTKRRKPAGLGGGDPLSEIADQVEVELSRLIDEDLIAVRYNEEFVEIEIKSKVLFPAGGTLLTDEAEEVLVRLAEILRNFYNFIRVEGFTDNVPIKSSIYPSNWELSAARAGAVVRLFAREGVRPGQMVAMGYGEFQPVADNSTPEGRNLNRRVSVIVMNQIDYVGLREELHLYSISEEGEVGRSSSSAWEPPIDVTNRPVTDQGNVDIRTIMRIPKPLPVEVVPEIRLDKGDE